ncbi:MAG TPA: protein kinase, partial [Candidatus Angelobacter sp.]|nr:protein kinase [Candidatus Angelobacter sp.]
MAPEIAIKIDNRYDVLGELGRGGMGIVYKATDVKMDRVVAIKVMTIHGAGRDEYQERFLREAKSIAKMQHPNIVVVHDYGYHNGAPYMVMEYVEGVPLDKVIASRVNLTALAKVDYIIQVCHALQYAHQQNIVHRDVKPGNIMVLEGGKRVKLLDFGIARAGGVSNLSKSGLAMGTTCYMSPEQTRGQKDLDARADIFSAAVVLYELLTGKPPWTGDGDYEVMTRIIQDPYPPLSNFLRNYPPALDHVFEMALAKDAGARYQTAEKMAQELAELEAPLKELVLEEAMVQFENGDLLRANDLVSQILRIDTRHREALDLRSKLQRVAQVQQRTEQVRKLRMAAEQAVGQKRYSDALAAIEQAIAIDSANTELLHFRELVRHELKRRDEVRKKLELAKRAQEINDLSTAQELVEKALEADPTDTQARMMKSTLEQEKKRLEQQEIAEDVSRALGVRAFDHARESIQQLEALDPAFPPLASLKKALQEGEEEEKRHIEIENLIRRIRQALDAGALADCLTLTEQALARFPGETRLLRLRAQAETLRDKAENEAAIQEQIQIIGKLADSGHNAEALATVEDAIKRLGTDYRLQAIAAQLRHTLEREHQVQAEQVALSRARKAIEARDLELAGKILTQAKIDFPNSKDVANALEIAQTAIARKADEARALDARKREIVETLERSLVNEPDPESQIRLAEEAVRRFPGNEAAERVLGRVRERQQQIASAVERAYRFEHSQRYSDAIQEWERVRRLWQQYPQISAHIARLTAATQPQPPSAVSEQPAAPAQSAGLSATSMMTAAPAKAPLPAAQILPKAVSAPTPIKSPVAEEVPVTRPSEISHAPNAEMETGPEEVRVPGKTEAFLRSKKLLLALTSAAVVIVGAFLLYRTLRTQPKPAPPKPPVVESHPPTITAPTVAPSTVAPQTVPPPPAIGRLRIRTNVDEVDILVDGVFKPGSGRREQTLPVVVGEHKITVRRSGYAAPPEQKVEIAKDGLSTLRFTLTKTADNTSEPEPDTYLVVKSQPGAKVRIDGNNAGEVQPDGSFSLKSAPGEHQVELSLNGYQPLARPVTVAAGNRRPIEMPLTPKPIPAIVSFDPIPASIQEGESIELKWTTQNATGVTIDGVGDFSPNGSTRVAPKLTGTMKYTLHAVGDGAPAEKTVSVNVTPVPKPAIDSFYPGAPRIPQGGSVRLFWTIKNATEGLIDPDVGKVPTQGSIEVTPSKTTTYILTAKGPGGNAEPRTTQVIVESAASPSLSPAPLPPNPDIKAVEET